MKHLQIDDEIFYINHTNDNDTIAIESAVIIGIEKKENSISGGFYILYDTDKDIVCNLCGATEEEVREKYKEYLFYLVGHCLPGYVTDSKKQ